MRWPGTDDPSFPKYTTAYSKHADFLVISEPQLHSSFQFHLTWRVTCPWYFTFTFNAFFCWKYTKHFAKINENPYTSAFISVTDTHHNIKGTTLLRSLVSRKSRKEKVPFQGSVTLHTYTTVKTVPARYLQIPTFILKWRVVLVFLL